MHQTLPKKLLILFLLLIASLTISTLFSKVPALSLVQTNRYLLIPLSFLGAIALNKKTNIKIYLQFLVIFITLISSFYFLKEFSPIIKNIEQGRRFLGPFGWHNQMGALLIFTLPPTFGLYYYSKNKFYLLLSLILSFFLALTYSRASWLSLSLAIFLFILINPKKIAQNINFKPLIGSILLGILLILTIPSIKQRVVSSKNILSPKSYQTSEKLRQEALFVALDIIKDNPLIGVGPGVYQAAYSHYQASPWLYSAYPHNQALQFTVELGFIGIIIIALIIIEIANLLLKNRKKIGKNHLQSALFVGTLSLFIHSFFDIDQNLPIFVFLFWFNAGLLYSKYIVNKKPSVKPLLIFCILLTLSLFIFNKFFLKYFSAQTHLKKAILAQQSKQYEISLKHINKAISLNPYSAEPHFIAAISFEKLDNIKNAQEQYLLAIQKNPYTHPKYHINLAALSLENGNIPLAHTILKQAVTSYFPKNKDYYALSHLLNQGGFENDLANLYTAYENVQNLRE